MRLRSIPSLSSAFPSRRFSTLWRPTMFIPRADGESDGCASGHVYCTPNTGSVAIVGDNSNDTSDDTSTTNYRNDKPGLHRYIGIAMVIVLVIVAFFSWLYYMKRSRSSQTGSSGSANLTCCGTRKKSPSTSGEVPGDSPAMRGVSEKKQSMMLQSEPKGLIKEVSGGVVMFTEAPRAALLPSKDRYPLGWEFEHVEGVRFEARTPRVHRHSSRSPRSPTTSTRPKT